jgi:hypothetical protein
MSAYGVWTDKPWAKKTTITALCLAILTSLAPPTLAIIELPINIVFLILAVRKPLSRRQIDKANARYSIAGDKEVSAAT